MDVHREIALLDAALDLLAEVGYERLTLTAVCERARRPCGSPWTASARPAPTPGGTRE